MGRPLKFPTPEILEKKINEYFAHCDAGEEVEYINKSGQLVKCVEKKPYTIEGLSLWLDCDSRTVREYGKQDAFYPTISRAKQRIIESSLAGGLGNRYNPRIVQLQVQSLDRSYVPTQQIEITAEPFEAKIQRLRQERMAEVGQGLDNYAIASPSAPVIARMVTHPIPPARDFKSLVC